MKRRKLGIFEREQWILWSILLWPVLVILLAAIFIPMYAAIYTRPVLQKVSATDDDLARITEAIQLYHESNGEYPSSLEELSPIAVKDGFSISGENYIYILSEEKFLIYSRGPDEDDDSGKKEYDSKNGIRSDGDIIVRVKHSK